MYQAYILEGFVSGQPDKTIVYPCASNSLKKVGDYLMQLIHIKCIQYKDTAEDTAAINNLANELVKIYKSKKRRGNYLYLGNYAFTSESSEKISYIRIAVAPLFSEGLLDSK